MRQLGLFEAMNYNPSLYPTKMVLFDVERTLNRVTGTLSDAAVVWVAFVEHLS